MNTSICAAPSSQAASIRARARAAFPGISQDRIEYPNPPTVFTPPDTGLWCRMTIQHAPAFMAGIAAMPYTRRPGQIVIQCFARLRTGTKAINDLTDALVAYFNYWSSGDLECIEASQLVVGEFEGFYQINVNIRFRAGRPRNTHPTRVERVFYAHTKVENMSSGAKVNSYLIAEVTPGVTPPVRSTPFD